MNLQIILTPLALGIEKPSCVCRMQDHIGFGKRAPDAITAHLKLKMELFSFRFALGCIGAPQSRGLILVLAPRKTVREQMGGKPYKNHTYVCEMVSGVKLKLGQNQNQNGEHTVISPRTVNIVVIIPLFSIYSIFMRFKGQMKKLEHTQIQKLGLESGTFRCKP